MGTYGRSVSLFSISSGYCCNDSSLDGSAIRKKVIKSSECHNHKPQPSPDTKRKRKMTKTNWQNLTRTKLTNAREAHRPAPSSPSEVTTMLKDWRNTRTNSTGWHTTITRSHIIRKKRWNLHEKLSLYRTYFTCLAFLFCPCILNLL